MKIISIFSICLQIYLAKPLVEFVLASAAIPDLFNSGNAKILAGHISSSLIFYLLGGVVPLIGLFTNMWVLRTFRPRWLLTWSIGCARLMWLYFPLGTIFGFLHARKIQTYLDSPQLPPNV